MLALAFILAVLAIPIAPAVILAIYRDGSPFRSHFWNT